MKRGIVPLQSENVTKHSKEVINYLRKLLYSTGGIERISKEEERLTLLRDHHFCLDSTRLVPSLASELQQKCST